MNPIILINKSFLATQQSVLLGIFVMVFCTLGFANDNIAEPDGILCNNAITIADIYDATSKKYYAFPDIPLVSEVKVNPDYRIGYIDSGVMNSHPQVAGLITEKHDFTGEGIEDKIGHGTFELLLSVRLMCTKLRKDNALNKFPSIFVAKVAPSNGPLRMSYVINAINWMAEKNVQFVCLPIAFIGEPAQFSGLKLALESHPQVTFLAAAGNFGPNRKVYPAAFAEKNVISVGSSDSPTSGIADVYVSSKAMTPREYYVKEQYEKALKLSEAGDDERANTIFTELTETPFETYAGASWLKLAHWQGMKQNFDQALQMLTKAESSLASDPQNLAIALTLEGAIHYKQRNFLVAEKVLQRSVGLDPSNVASHNNLGLTEIELKKFSSALEQYEIIYKLDPEFPNLDGVLKPLREAKKNGTLRDN